jgi:hypothetical protein
LKEEEQTTFRKFKVFAALQANGNVAMNQGGRGFDWQVRYRNVPVSSYTGESPRVFARHALWQRANLPYRGYTVTDQISKREMLENRGQAQLIDVAGKMANRLKESIEEHLAKEVFVDGNAPGNENRWHGLESMFSVNGTVTISGASAGQQRAANAADPFGFPNDEYAGLKCGLGQYAGSQTGTGAWPAAAADPEYDFWSPLVCNYTSTYFGAAASTPLLTWRNNCLEAIRLSVNHAKRNDTKENQIDMILLDRSMYIELLNRLDARERAIVTKSNGLRSFGFDTTEIDGIEVASDYGCGAGMGYALSIGNMEMKVMTGQLLEAEGPYFNEELSSYRYAVSVLANIKMKSPRNFVKFAALA